MTRGTLKSRRKRSRRERRNHEQGQTAARRRSRRGHAVIAPRRIAFAADQDLHRGHRRVRYPAAVFSKDLRGRIQATRRGPPGAEDDRDSRGFATADAVQTHVFRCAVRGNARRPLPGVGFRGAGPLQERKAFRVPAARLQHHPVLCRYRVCVFRRIRTRVRFFSRLSPRRAWR